MNAKERALDRLWHGIQECVWAGCSAEEIKRAVAEHWEQAHLDEAREGKKEILK